MKALEEVPKHVLLAEDDDDDFDFFSMAIDETSLTVILKRAENGDILLQLLDQNIPDILFMDIFLPYKTGRECLREIRANRKYDSLPIIIYTSVKELEQIEFCYREGSNFYMIKPTSFNELKAILKKIISLEWKKMMYYPTLSEFVVNPQ
ncbi:response regulator [Chryseosolibacter indicus]|uniref:Response regulator n=1 Tax=Chryseosolibacter indicus TaxID=2782351 RepID=A0ABS5VT29_9BACT|nr:response regulator [Chryseosolibacter indicus]MBT1703972.1 response regulator [Chryseosolibacter indicus]